MSWRASKDCRGKVWNKQSLSRGLVVKLLSVFGYLTCIFFTQNFLAFTLKVIRHPPHHVVAGVHIYYVWMSLFCLSFWRIYHLPGSRIQGWGFLSLSILKMLFHFGLACTLVFKNHDSCLCYLVYNLSLLLCLLLLFSSYLLCR